MSLASGHIVCGLPHILTGRHPGYLNLTKAMTTIGDGLEAAGVERILYFSTQWISVLGHSFQAGTNVSGLHVDENWHDLPDMPFDFKVDKSFAEKLSAVVAKNGYQTRLIDYKGFPVDTGTIVADLLLNKGRFSVGMVSCCVYSDYDDTTKMFQIMREVIEQDSKKTAIVAISQLSGRFFTTDIDLREDQIRDAEDDKWNQKLLTCLQEGRYSDLEKLRDEYSKTCKVDMGLKVMAVLKGLDLLRNPAKVQSYEAVYGTGNAVVSFS